LRPRYPAAVVAGNVETSQCITDALYGALGVLAASQGTMNNFTFGNDRYQYYETVAGGSGAGPGFDGADVVQTHMTNSRLTDPEVLEWRFPVRLESFEIRRGSGGRGRWRGGEGAIRRVRFLEPMTAAILSGHRKVRPHGMAGGETGLPGRNYVERIDGGVSERRPLDAWARDGVGADILPAAPGADPVGLLMLEEADGPTYWLVFGNWYVLTRYNRSRLYATAVWQLAQALVTARGAAASAQPDRPAASPTDPANATPANATFRAAGKPKRSVTLPAMIGATPPPKISPAPTTTPMAAEISPRGADSVAIGPVISATLPRQKNEQTNSATNSGSTAAPMLANHQTDSVAPTKPKIASGLRPKRSDNPGQPNCPRKPPNPSADATTPASVRVSERARSR